MLRQQNLFKLIYKFHVYAGLFIAVHFTVFALTGLPLLFKHEILGKNQLRKAESTATTDSSAQYETALETLRTSYPEDRPLALYPDEKDPQILNARLGLHGATRLHDARKVTLNLFSGKEMAEQAPPAAGFFGWILRLHRELLLGQAGKIYIGFVGFIYVLMLLTGFFIYGKFMKGKSFGDIRRARLPQMIDLHKFLGVVSFGWGLVIGTTGVLLAFNGTLIKVFQYQSLKHLASQYTNSSNNLSASGGAALSDVVRNALANKAETAISYISFPGSEYGIPDHYLVLVKGATKLTKRLNELVVVDAQTAKVSQVLELPFYLKAAILSEPLHFGNYGGLPLKILWALFALGSLAVVLLGLSTYFIKRQKNAEIKKATGIAKEIAGTGVLHQKPSFQKPYLKKPHVLPSSLEKILRRRYALPSILAVISIVGIISALFAHREFKILAVGVLILPLLVVLVRVFVRFGTEGKNT